MACIGSREPQLLSSGFDLGRHARPGDELDHQAGDRHQGSGLATRVALGYRRELLQQGQRVTRDEFVGPGLLSVAIMQAQKDFVHQLHHRAPAIDLLRLKHRGGQRRQDVAIAPAQLGPVLDHDPCHLARCQAALQAKHAAKSVSYGPIPDAPEQGMFCGRAGN